MAAFCNSSRLAELPFSGSFTASKPSVWIPVLREVLDIWLRGLESFDGVQGRLWQEQSGQVGRHHSPELDAGNWRFFEQQPPKAQDFSVVLGEEG